MANEQRKITPFLREQFKGAHGFLEATLGDATPEQVHWAPPGKARPIAAHYAHVLVSEDNTVNGMLKGATPLAATALTGRTGVSELPPQGFDWGEWAQRVQVDLPALRQYAQAVYANTYDYLSSLTDEDLERPLDLSALGVGQQTVGWMLAVLLGNVDHHCGEISCLKGLQGAKGYPM